jgi:hypothetical protein
MVGYDTHNMTAYAIALQRAIEHHCRGKQVPEDIAKHCPYHAKMLNQNLLSTANEVQP